MEIKQEAVFKAALESGDYVETFICWRREGYEWVCSRTALESFDGSKFTIKHWSYTTTTEPKVEDFA